MFLKFNQKPPTFTSKRLSNIFIHVYEKILREPLSSRTGEYPVKMIMKYKQFKSTYMNKSLSRQMDSNRRPMAYETGKLSCSTLICNFENTACFHK